jgi:hypothetical protein
MITVAVALAAVALPALGSPLSTSTEPLVRGTVGLNLAPIFSHPAAEQALIPNQYIVVLDQDAATDQANAFATASAVSQVLMGTGREPEHVYTHALAGFSAQMTEAEAIALSEDPRVKFVEEDSIMWAVATQTNPPSWGLDRIDQRSNTLNGTYTYTSTGAGVNGRGEPYEGQIQVFDRVE